MNERAKARGVLAAGALAIGAGLGVAAFAVSRVQASNGVWGTDDGVGATELLPFLVVVLAIGLASVAHWNRSVAEAHTRTLSVERAQRDPLTGLPNRIALTDHLHAALARARDGHHKLAVLFLDLDRFKAVNDTFGHATGDAVLSAVARRLSEAVREDDLLARLGGDEFVVVCERLSPSEADAIGERIVTALVAPVVVEGREFSLSLCAGVALSSGDDTTPDELLRDADTAMYRAKAKGRGSLAFFDRAMTKERAQRVAIEQRLEAALATNQFCLHYQPVVATGSGEIVGMEALLRWQDPDRGLVAPGEFVPVLDQTGLIVPAGTWVLEEACRQLTRWGQMHSAAVPLHMAVNVSAIQLAQPNFARVVVAILESTGADPRHLILEITEAALMGDVVAAWSGLRMLKALGVRLALDDFGTGYSSLSYVRNFALDLIKIDQSFVRGLTTSLEDAAIVNATITLAHALGLRAVGEGVETPEQLGRLKALGCDWIQGYHVSRPQPPEIIEELLRAPALT